MPSIRYWSVLGAMLALAGCAAPTQPSSQPFSSGIYFVGRPDHRQRLTADQRALRIASAYEIDFRSGGMSGVIHDINKCYLQTSPEVGNSLGLRDCMVLDYTAYNIDQVDGRRTNGSSLPFFTDDAVKARLAQYGPVAQFDTAGHMISYLKDMHQLVQRYLVHDWKEANGYCTRHVTDRDCSLE